MTKKKTEITSKEEYEAFYKAMTADNDAVTRKRPTTGKAAPKKQTKKK